MIELGSPRLMIFVSRDRESGTGGVTVQIANGHDAGRILVSIVGTVDVHSLEVATLVGDAVRLFLLSPTSSFGDK